MCPRQLARSLLQFVLDLATVSSKSAGRLTVHKYMEHARLEKPNLVLALIFLQPDMCTYRTTFLIWRTSPAFSGLPLKKIKSAVSVLLATIPGAFCQESASLYPLGNSTRFAAHGCAEWDWLRIT